MENLEEALRNIDIFCKVLVAKLTTNSRDPSTLAEEPMEKILYEKNVIGEGTETNIKAHGLIPLSHLEHPLIDVFEENDHLKILIQKRCGDKLLNVHTCADGIEVFRRECHIDCEGKMICVDKFQKIDMPTNNLQVENIRAECNNDAFFEVEIPKRER